jgi:tRNA dimethylallyltransferase
MLDEAKTLNAKGLSFERMESLGLEYRYMARHLTGKISFDGMMAELEKEIMRYAKRQRTWFKRNKETVWFRQEQTNEILDTAKDFLEKSNPPVML